MAFEPFFKTPRKTAAERQAERRRGGWRTAPKRNRFGEPTRAAEKAKADRHATEVKRATRIHVWRRSDVCEYCGMTEDQTAALYWKRAHEQDEVLPRSLTRGLPAETRFAPGNTARACCECHRKKTAHLIGVVFHDEQLGMDGDVDITDGDGTIIRQIRRPGIQRGAQ